MLHSFQHPVTHFSLFLPILFSTISNTVIPLLTLSHSNMQPNMESSPEVMTLHSKDPHFEIELHFNETENSALTLCTVRTQPSYPLNLYFLSIIRALMQLHAMKSCVNSCVKVELISTYSIFMQLTIQKQFITYSYSTLIFPLPLFVCKKSSLTLFARL
jgi:hypothetical protein